MKKENILFLVVKEFIQYKINFKLVKMLKYRNINILIVFKIVVDIFLKFEILFNFLFIEYYIDC